MTYSIVIPSLANDKTLPYLKLCVESLRASGFDGEIIVVTNGTPQPVPLFIRGISRRLHTRDQGQCIATNIGAQATTGKYLMVSNDDMYYAPGWNKNLRFEYPVFSPNLVEPQNNLGSAAPFLKWGHDGFTLDEFDRTLFDEWMDFGFHKVKEELKEGPGFNLPFFIKKDFWEKLGGYDTAFDPWGSNSDTDLQTRINLAGVTPMRLNDVLVYHFSNKSGTFDGTHQDFYHNNLEYFKSKHGFDRDELGSDVWSNSHMLPEDDSKIKSPRWQYV